MNWWKCLRGRVRLQELLAHHTTFKIGGPAKFFIEPKDSDDLKFLLNLAKRYNMPLLVIGAGSNILVSDQGIDKLVIRLNAPYFRKTLAQGNRLSVGSGVMLAEAVRKATQKGLSGIEFLTGIPGTAGGAVVMNAGITEKTDTMGLRKRSIADAVGKVTVMDYNGAIKTLGKKDIRFGYRKSNLSRYIVLRVQLKLIKRNKEEVRDALLRYRKYRLATQDYGFPSSGCIFKNPPGHSAGKLIDACRLKGRRVNDACVSKRHANFIINLGEAKARDVLKLMSLIKKRVESKFNISLEPEIKIWN